MNVELLVTTMNATDFALVDKINICSNAIIANQANFFDYEEVHIRNNRIKLVTTHTKGASLNRNIAISLATEDILFFCDDDANLPSNYEELIVNEFEKHPNALAIKFFCVCTTEGAPLSLKKPKKFKKASRLEVFSAGIHAFAIKKSIVEKNDLRFLESIGPGKKHNCGEDSLFLKTLLDKHIKIYLSPVQIGTITRETSSWFTGFHENYFVTSGYVYSKLYGRLACLAALRKAVKMRKQKKSELSMYSMMKHMLTGIREEKQ